MQEDMRGQENDTKRKVRVAWFVKDFAKCSEEFRGLKTKIYRYRLWSMASYIFHLRGWLQRWALWP